MNRRIKIVFGVCLVLVLATLIWQHRRPREPAYQGKRLTDWLEEYNRAGSMDKTEPISEAIRAMGTNSLPFLVEHIKHADSPIKQKFLGLIRKQKFIELPFYTTYPYRSPSILALHVLGSEAEPILPELSKVAEDPHTSWWGMVSLLAIGTNSIPTLAKACQNPNAEVRTQAARMIATLKSMPPPWFSWGWNKAPGNGPLMFGIGTHVSLACVRELANMLDDPDPAIRRASIEVIVRYHRPPYSGLVKSAVPSLIEALDDPDQDVRQSAAKALENIAPKAIAEAGPK